MNDKSFSEVFMVSDMDAEVSGVCKGAGGAVAKRTADVPALEDQGENGRRK